MAAEGDRTGFRVERAGPSGEVVVLRLEAPLTADLRAGVIAALAADPDGAVVLAGGPRGLAPATPADLPEGDALQAPLLADLAQAVASRPRPVVAALQGAVIGSGAALALAAHARVAASGMRLAFPDIAFGLPPGGGATQRLPRLAGAGTALSLLVRGEATGAEPALVAGIVDQVVDGDPVAAAVALALSMPGPRPTEARDDGLADVAAFQADIAAARAALRGAQPLAARVIDCIEGALYLPFENGLALEAVALEDFAETGTARALRAAALAERRAAALPADVAAARPPMVATLGVLGGGGPVPQLVIIALMRGMAVHWADADDARLQAGRDWVAGQLAAEAQAGRLTAAQADADLARLRAGSDAASADMSATGLILRAGAPMPGARGPAGVAQLVLGGAEGRMGLMPSPSARVSELALPADADAGQVATAVQVLRRLGLPPVLTGRMPVVGRRTAAAGRAALTRLLALGVPRRAIEAALAEVGAGLPDLPDPVPAPRMRALPAEDIRRRWLAAMANEGLRLLDTRLARRPGDIDHLAVAGYGFPRALGGPMHQAHCRGLLVLRQDLRELAGDDPPEGPLWAPDPLIDRLIQRGLRLSDLDAM